MSPAGIHLALFLSRATSLTRWERLGIFSRETALYKALAERGRVSLVTSGGREELALRGDLATMEILYNRWGLSPNLYSLLAAWLHRLPLREATLYKSNQLDGAWTAILAGKLHRKPVIVRVGYLWAENYLRTNKAGFKSALIEKLEAFSIRQADALMVTTAAMGAFLSRKYRVAPETIHVSPNYVDTGRFRPLENIPKISGRVCFVGRLSPEKNLPVLIEAVAGLTDVSLQLIGDGPARQELQRVAESQRVGVIFSGRLPHPKLPEHLHRSEIFVLVSRFEGHPKALIEAMACGVAVIGADVEGIRQVIQPGETGLLCQPEVGSIRSAIRTLRDNAPLRRELGENARQYVLDHFTLGQAVERELRIYRSVIEGCRPR